VKYCFNHKFCSFGKKLIRTFSDKRKLGGQLQLPLTSLSFTTKPLLYCISTSCKMVIRFQFTRYCRPTWSCVIISANGTKWTLEEIMRLVHLSVVVCVRVSVCLCTWCHTQLAGMVALFCDKLLHNDWRRYALYRVGQKTGPVWALITQRWLMVERRVIRQKFQNAVENKRHICIVKHLNILCLICINIRHPRNSAKFDCNTWI